MRHLQVGLIIAVAAVCGCAPQGGTQIAQDGSHKERSADGKIEGDVVGYAAPGSRFARLHIGMSQRQAEDIVGRGNDSGSHITGKQFIPFYFGGDQYRVVSYYKGEGQLEFAPRDFMGQANTLLKIVNNPAETGYAR